MNNSIQIPTSLIELVGNAVLDPFDVELTSEVDHTSRIESLASELNNGNNDESTFDTQLTQFMIDDMYSLVNGFASLSDENKSLFSETMSEAARNALDVATGSYGSCLSQNAKNNIKIVLYFTQQLCLRAESGVKTSTISGDNVASSFGDNADEDFVAPVKGKGKKTATASKKKTSSSSSSFLWTNWRKTFLSLLQRMVSSDPSNLWAMSIVQENFLSSIWTYALQLLETKPQGIAGAGSQESSARTLCVDVVVKSVFRFGSASSSGALSALATALIDSMMRSEAMCIYAADICSKAHINLVAEIVGEIAHMQMNKLSSTGVKNIGSFIESLAKASPEHMTMFMPILKPQVDSGAHQIRFDHKNFIMNCIVLSYQIKIYLLVPTIIISFLNY